PFSGATRCFFFSSRRRHTSFSRDWSSDVCSSDLTFCCSTEEKGVSASGPALFACAGGLAGWDSRLGTDSALIKASLLAMPLSMQALCHPPVPFQRKGAIQAIAEQLRRRAAPQAKR